MARGDQWLPCAAVLPGGQAPSTIIRPGWIGGQSEEITAGRWRCRAGRSFHFCRWLPRLLPWLHQLHQAQGILRRISCLVVVEVAVDVAALFGPGADALRPGPERRVAVGALVGTFGAVQADVDEIRRDLFRRLLPGELVEAERRLALCERVQDLGPNQAGSRNSKA